MKFNLLVIIKLIRGKYFKYLFNELINKFYSNQFIYILRYTRNNPVESFTNSKIKTVRKALLADVTNIFNINEQGILFEDFKERLTRLSMFHDQINTCYVAELSNNIICFAAWLIRKEEIKKINKTFKGGFSQINNDEILVEGVYTIPVLRNQGIMKEGLKQIIYRFCPKGNKYILAYVKLQNMPSLRAFKRIGFEFDSLKRIRWIFFHKKCFSLPISKEHLELWEKI